LIILDGISKKYQELLALNGVSLAIPAGKIYGIIGRSGAGKSTLVRIISMLERPDTGSVHYGDSRVDNLDSAELLKRRRRIGMIFQNFNLFSSRNVAGNIAYPLEIAGYPRDKITLRVHELLGMVGLEDKIYSSISKLSGGQKQRVAIARALANHPDVLFCDEATSALDPQTTISILDLIRDIQRQMGLTVVMITHQMEVVREICDNVSVIDNGAIVESGAVKEIFSYPKTDVARDFLRGLNI
jgi:D-methionine transport system ATP-binding protein